ncbi:MULTISPECIES: Gfo/Idh/MocA family oxidoreductase [unclassified Sinorhizobium]|uniref:Gfo/Idh/MocA family protein n=1 Tax=unclassified Sinorhizobium TaxID=2613772 RepID=UPI0024C35218|nr:MULTISPECIES: Gfo/Idh/MocA family oxidoreductase [unclassified Sinorhizobium]MDK1377888.1 Gfo/Idh/MocA family oxidoreductase [Sinorhizobium sp. 6-70]MDK1481441.1 Gfo/Idh/MocA family oxidoreductase [Sinorhizobium sp. 6-117]
MKGNAIAVIGAGMIGAAHAFGYRTNLPRFEDRIAGIRLATACDGNEALAGRLAATWGFEKTETNLNAVIADPEIGIVSVCLPNALHAEVTLAAIAAGKHVLCEKPLALNAEEALRIHRAAIVSPVVSATVFNYRRIPAVAAIRDIIAAGEIGDLVNLLVQYESEYAADPDLPHSWRYEKSRAGAGALLDVGTHAIDTARFLCGEVSEIAGAIGTISVKERFLPAAASIGHEKVTLSTESRPVDNDDVMSALLRFENGCQGMFLASRVAVGMGNTLSFSVTGTRGALRYNSRTPAHYEIARFDGSGQSPFALVANNPALPYAELLPVPHDGVAIGYAEVFGFMIHEFLEAIAANRPMQNGSTLDGLRAAQILDAIQSAADTGAAVKISHAD